MALSHAKLTEDVLGAAMQVLNTLRPGLSEKAYENALVVELRKRRRTVQQQKRFDVHYDGVLVDTLIPDLLVDDVLIVDPKVVEAFTPSHVAQMIGYLAVTQLPVALLLNFKFSDLRWKRIVR